MTTVRDLMDLQDRLVENADPFDDGDWLRAAMQARNLDDRIARLMADSDYAEAWAAYRVVVGALARVSGDRARRGEKNGSHRAALQALQGHCPKLLAAEVSIDEKELPAA
jgi:hypothetical protein